MPSRRPSRFFRQPAPAIGTAGAAALALAPGPRWSRLLLWIGVAIAVDLAPIGIGYRLGWLTFTYGDQQLAATRAMTALWALPLLVVLTMRFYERVLRGQLFAGALESWGAPAAWALTLLCGTALALPVVAPGFTFSEPAYVAAALVTALAREIGSTVLYRASGLVAAGLFRGTLLFVDFYLIADWLAPVFPSANYDTSGDSFLPAARRVAAGGSAAAGPLPAGPRPGDPRPSCRRTGRMNRQERPRWIVATVFALVVMISWTLVVKYLVPLLFGLALALAGDDAGGAGGSGSAALGRRSDVGFLAAHSRDARRPPLAAAPLRLDLRRVPGARRIGGRADQVLLLLAGTGVDLLEAPLVHEQDLRSALLPLPAVCCAQAPAGATCRWR